MFKLKKILGARCNAPEIVEITIQLSCDVHAGKIYTFATQVITNHDGTERLVAFIPIEDVYGYGEVKKIKGYYVTSNMIFEGKFFGNITFVAPGICVGAHLDDNDLIDGVSSGSGTFAFIVSTDEYEKTGNVTFRLNI